MQSPGGVLCKKGIHKKVCNIYRKALVLESFFNKVASWRHVALSKKILAQVFSREFYKIFTKKYFEEHLQMPASVEAHIF